MSGPTKKKTPAEELIESLLKDVGEDNSDFELKDESDTSSTNIDGLVLDDIDDEKGFVLSTENNEYDKEEKSEFESTRNVGQSTVNVLDLSLEDEAPLGLPDIFGSAAPKVNEEVKLEEPKPEEPLASQNQNVLQFETKEENNKTQLISPEVVAPAVSSQNSGGDSDKTVAVSGYQVRAEADYLDKERISVGQNRPSTGYQNWNNSGSAESNLAQAENLRIAQEKIMELERENEKLRSQNEELMAASEIIKERSDLLSSQLTEYKNDRDGLEDSFKNEIVLLKNHLARKDSELQKSQFKAEELDSRLKFDMKKIRIRERELENRLELIRAEKNAIVKNKDEQILDLRRKMDILQMEVESYRQKCIELNKSIESSQESFKRTTRALRLAMANLELQEENKVPLKKVD